MSLRSVALSWIWPLGIALLLSGCADDEAEVGAAQSLETNETPIQITAPRLRRPLPGTETSVGYFELTNHLPETVVLVGAHHPLIGAIEMHETVEREGMLRMRRLPQVEIQSGQTLRFEPGGKHLMLFRVEPTLQAPAVVTLEFAQRQSQEVNFRVFSLGQMHDQD